MSDLNKAVKLSHVLSNFKNERQAAFDSAYGEFGADVIELDYLYDHYFFGRNPYQNVEDALDEVEDAEYTLYKNQESFCWKLHEVLAL